MKKKTGKVECLVCSKAVPINKAVLVVKDAEETDPGYHLCDACRLDDLGPHDAENSNFVEQIEQESGPAGLHSLILQALKRLEQGEETFTLAALRRDVQPILDAVDAGEPLVQIVAHSGMETTLGEVLGELEADLGIDQMNEATRLLYDLLTENADRLDAYPYGHGDMIHMALDGHEYFVVCDIRTREAPGPGPKEGLIDLCAKPMYGGAKLLYQMLEESLGRLKEASILEDGTLEITLDERRYRVICDRIVRDGDMIVMEGPRQSEGRGVFDKSRLHLVYCDDSEEDRDVDCAVTIQSDHISVRYDDELGGSPITVIYRGWDHGDGHFELRFKLRDEHDAVGEGWATLHRLSPRSQILEGFWKEVWGSEESHGAWQIELQE